MFRSNQTAKTLFSLLVIASFTLAGLPVRATDLVPTDDLTGGASVFVFRESRKKPQEKAAAARSFRSSGAGLKTRRERLNAQVAASRKKKADAAKARAAMLARARARERNAKLKLSNTLTARAETLLAKGDIVAATTNFREALKANPKNADAHLGLSEALTVRGIETAGENYNESAVVFFDEAVKLDRNNEIAFAKLGEIHDAKGRNAMAIANYEKALAIDPQFSSLYLPVGLAYVQGGDAVKAENYLAKAEAAGFESSESRMVRAVIYQNQNKYPEALAALDRIIKAEPQNGAAYYQRAVVFDRMNQTDRSIDAYKDAIRVDPAFASSWFDLGVIYYNREDYNNSLKAYQQVLRIEPNNAAAHANIASVYRQLDRYEEANVAYAVAEKNNKGMNGDADFYSEWGFCLGKTNEWDKAVHWLATAHELNSSAVDYNNMGWGYYNLGRADLAAKDEPGAKANFALGKAFLEKAVEKDPKLDAAYLNLGATHNSLGEYQAGANALNQALSLHADWIIAINQLGGSYRGMNNLVAAADTFNRVLRLDENNVFGLFSLGEVYYASGNKKEAKKVQNRLKKLNPAMASRLDGIISGKAVVDEVKRKIPKVRRWPY